MLTCISVLGIVFAQCGAYTLFHTLCLQQEPLQRLLTGLMGLLVWLAATLSPVYLDIAQRSKAPFGPHQLLD
jgi:cytochrome c oxidase assembly factor CtaG